MNSRALITGITGQDGSYLAEFLLEKGYAVTGVTSGKSGHENIREITDRITLLSGDISDQAFVREMIARSQPDEIYNLASVATVLEPWTRVTDIALTTALTTRRARAERSAPPARRRSRSRGDRVERTRR